MNSIPYFDKLAGGSTIFTRCYSAIVGHDQKGFPVYQHDKLVQIFEADGMTIDEAIEWVDYNIIGVQPQNYTILYT